MSEDLVYKIALTLIPQIGPVQAKILLQYFEPAGVFRAKLHQLEKLEGIGLVRANSIKSFDGFAEAEKEIRFIEEYRITPLFIGEDPYPKRLLNCYDSPVMLYYRGNADLNASRTVAIIGTRRHTEYGRQLTEKLVQDLACHNVTVVSGLAYGIDAIAHRASMINSLPTVGVLAHGLDQVYPFQHTSLANSMISGDGGILTEFRSGTRPDRHNFPVRNRVVAGISDATVVVETGHRGGSIITVELANGYNRDVFAFPGRTTDSRSEGCNHLIRTNKAILLTDASELVAAMNWDDRKGSGQRNAIARQRAIFIDLTPEEQMIVDILKAKNPAHIDDINLLSGLSASRTASAILNLELQNVIVSLPGKLYRLD